MLILRISNYSTLRNPLGEVFCYGYVTGVVDRFARLACITSTRATVTIQAPNVTAFTGVTLNHIHMSKFVSHTHKNTPRNYFCQLAAP